MKKLVLALIMLFAIFGVSFGAGPLIHIGESSAVVSHDTSLNNELVLGGIILRWGSPILNISLSDGYQYEDTTIDDLFSYLTAAGAFDITLGHYSPTHVPTNGEGLPHLFPKDDLQVPVTQWNSDTMVVDHIFITLTEAYNSGLLRFGNKLVKYTSWVSTVGALEALFDYEKAPIEDFFGPTPSAEQITEYGTIGTDYTRVWILYAPQFMSSTITSTYGNTVYVWRYTDGEPVYTFID